MGVWLYNVINVLSTWLLLHFHKNRHIALLAYKVHGHTCTSMIMGNGTQHAEKKNPTGKKKLCINNRYWHWTTHRPTNHRQTHTSHIHTSGEVMGADQNHTNNARPPWTIMPEPQHSRPHVWTLHLTIRQIHVGLSREESTIGAQDRTTILSPP